LQAYCWLLVVTLVLVVPFRLVYWRLPLLAPSPLPLVVATNALSLLLADAARRRRRRFDAVVVSPLPFRCCCRCCCCCCRRLPLPLLLSLRLLAVLQPAGYFLLPLWAPAILCLPSLLSIIASAVREL
jgi:hypothetical protein